MARAPRESRLESRDARLKLKPRKEPYWRQIVPGTFVGYYKGSSDRPGSWIARQRAGDGYRSQRIGTADDTADADGDVVLSYGQAVRRATDVRVEERAPLPRHYGDGVTLNKLFDDYLDDRAVTPGGRLGRVMAKGTLTVSRLFWNRHARTSIGTKLVSALKPDDLRRWHVGIVNTPPTVRGKVQAYDPTDPEQMRSRRATANRILVLAKAAMTWGRQHNKLPANMPDWWRQVQPFKLGDDPPPRMLDQDEVRRLLNAAAPDLRDLLTGALMTGGRYSELRALKVGDYDRTHANVRLYQFKTGKTLWQPVTPEGRAFFDALTAGRPASDLIFKRADGSPWAQSDVRRPMLHATIAARLQDVSFKTTRATYGKALLLATRDLELVAKALGHSDSRITRQHYAQLLPNEVAAGIAMMPAFGIATDTNMTVMAGRKRSRASG